VIYRDHLYWVSDTGIAYCIDKRTGDEVYGERLPGASGRSSVYASVVVADEKIYAVTRTAGAFVLAAKPQFELLAHNVIKSDSSVFNASPAVVNGQLLLRSDQHLYCVGEE
jgi:outer membrane protein assembly factor BamB